MTNKVSETRGGGHTSSFPGARSALTLLLLINLFNYVDRYVLSAVMLPMKDSFFAHGRGIETAWLAAVLDWVNRNFHLELQDTLLGLLTTAFMLSYMVMAPVFARLSDRISRWAIVGFGVLVWSLATGASGLAATFVMLFATRCFVGIGEAAYGPVAPSIISDHYPVSIRGRVLSWFYVAIPVGSALGYAIGGIVAGSNISEWGARLIGVHQESWRWAFYVVVIPGIVLGLWSFLMRDPPRGQADPGRTPDVRRPTSNAADRTTSEFAHPTRHTKWADYMVLVRTPSYVLCTLGMAAMTFAMGGMSVWMPYYLGTKPGHPANIGVIGTTWGAIVAVAGLSSTLLGGYLADALRKRFSGSYFLVSGIAMLVGFPVFLITLNSPFPWIWVFAFLTCFCLFFNTGPTNTILANVSHPSLRAAAFALNIFVIHALGDVLSPVVIGFLNDYFHGEMNKSFEIVGVTFVVAAVAWLAGMRYLERDTRLAPERL